MGLIWFALTQKLLIWDNYQDASTGYGQTYVAES
jgi:hypothetical protein